AASSAWGAQQTGGPAGDGPERQPEPTATQDAAARAVQGKARGKAHIGRVTAIERQENPHGACGRLTCAK
ncbi:MAG TPA: hypothetical protein VNA30_02715, partial [Mycobacteriales bacterium]|nr:hypothetical protein [Mycobacteriales bacterium]